MMHLTNLFTAGKYEQVQKDALAMVNDSRYEFIDFEDQFNRVAYNMIGGERNQGAIFVLDLTTKAFPNSITSWYNLGDAYTHEQNYTKAKACYNQVISLNAESSQANNARKALEKISKQ